MRIQLSPMIPVQKSWVTRGSRPLLTLLLCLAASGTWAREEPPKVDKDGLHLVEHSELRLVYKRPGVDFRRYDKVILLEVYVAFQKNWQHIHNANDPFLVNKQEVEAIKQRVGNEFQQRFTRELEKKGYPVVDKTATGPDVLIVRPAIINLDVVAPDTLRADDGETFVASAGQMTLYAELYDSVSSQLIGRVTDPREDQESGSFMGANRVTNKAAEDRIVDIWANALADHLRHTTRGQ